MNKASHKFRVNIGPMTKYHISGQKLHQTDLDSGRTSNFTENAVDKLLCPKGIGPYRAL